jgi:hypothetical protein
MGFKGDDEKEYAENCSLAAIFLIQVLEPVKR